MPAVHPTAAELFDRALAALTTDRDAADLLPARVARACSEALPVDGAGLSLHAGALRVPIGASGPVTAHAERLQFTFGDGPSLRAFDDGRAIAFAPQDIQRNWPDLYASLLADSPYRGVLSLPLPEPLGPTVVLDLWVGDPAALPRLERGEVTAVVERVTDELARDLREGARIPAADSSWLEGDDALVRASTWQAVGLVGMSLLLDTPDALEVVRAAAISSGRSVDDVATDLLTGRLQPLDLGAAPVPDEG
jgi:hypothetical protein